MTGILAGNLVKISPVPIDLEGLVGGPRRHYRFCWPHFVHFEWQVFMHTEDVPCRVGIRAFPRPGKGPLSGPGRGLGFFSGLRVLTGLGFHI